jgi:hypothetical protein
MVSLSDTKWSELVAEIKMRGRQTW